MRPVISTARSASSASESSTRSASTRVRLSASMSSCAARVSSSPGSWYTAASDSASVNSMRGMTATHMPDFMSGALAVVSIQGLNGKPSESSTASSSSSDCASRTARR